MYGIIQCFTVYKVVIEYTIMKPSRGSVKMLISGNSV